MTNTKWQIDNVSIQEIVEHLKKFHAVPFDNRNSLSEEEFIEQHFPALVKEQESLRYCKNAIAQRKIELREKLMQKGATIMEASIAANKAIKTVAQISEEGMGSLRRARTLLKTALNYCEKHKIPIARVIDQVEDQNEGSIEWQWRICTPNAEQVELMRIKRWYSSAEGYFNKAVMQQNMVADADLDVLLDELKSTIIRKQNGRHKPSEENAENTKGKGTK